MEIVSEDREDGRLVIRFESHGMQCAIRSNPSESGGNHWCGYVMVPKGHPLYHRDYMDTPANKVSVHGGLTFSSFSYELSGDPIDHPSDRWWVGFDCIHAGDDYRIPLMKGADKYWTAQEVVRETKKLAKQLSLMK